MHLPHLPRLPQPAQPPDGPDLQIPAQPPDDLTCVACHVTCRAYHRSLRNLLTDLTGCAGIWRSGPSGCVACHVTCRAYHRSLRNLLSDLTSRTLRNLLSDLTCGGDIQFIVETNLSTPICQGLC